MSEEKELPLMEDFRECLALVKKCRSLIEADPVLPNGKGGTQTNPALTILINQQAHLASLADIIGPIRVEKELADEFREARNLSRSLMPGVLEAPVIAGQRHQADRNPYAQIMQYCQSHTRACAKLLNKAKAEMNPDAANEYDNLFKEPELKLVSGNG